MTSCLLFLTVTLQANQPQPSYESEVIKKTDTLIERINSPKTGVNSSLLSQIKPVFFNAARPPRPANTVALPLAKPIQVLPALTATFGQRARLNGKWYGKGASIGEYTLTHVGPYNAVVIREGKSTMLTLKTDSPKITIEKVTK